MAHGPRRKRRFSRRPALSRSLMSMLGRPKGTVTRRGLRKAAQASMVHGTRSQRRAGLKLLQKHGRKVRRGKGGEIIVSRRKGSPNKKSRVWVKGHRRHGKAVKGHYRRIR